MMSFSHCTIGVDVKGWRLGISYALVLKSKILAWFPKMKAILMLHLYWLVIFSAVYISFESAPVGKRGASFLNSGSWFAI